MRNDAGYAEISDYGFLSDCRSAALVAHDGSIDWLCWPRFDSSPLFSALLDARRGGRFQIAPLEPYTVQRHYEPGTNILRTEFKTERGGVVHLEDWLHIGARQAVCRRVSCLEGEVEMEIECDPRPDFAASEGAHHFARRLGYLIAEMSPDVTLVLGGMQSAWQQDSGHILAKESFRIQSGERLGFTLGLNRPGPSNLRSARRRAVEFWGKWSNGMKLPEDPHAARAVQRSALVLKGLQYAPSGAIVAAPTTSLPETIGGERNYDYRYTWLRDSVFTLYALRNVGRNDEAESFFDFLKSIALRSEDRSLPILCSIDGTPGPIEDELTHLEGYKGSRPVRIGNAATGQRQLDIYGELADAIALHHRRKSDDPLTRYRWLLVREIADRAASQWREPDEGIWEVRGPTQHFVYSKVQCWVALDRAIRLVSKAPPDMIGDSPEHWRRERDALKADVMAKGFDRDLGAFTQSYGSKSLDAANLLMARVGFIPPSDERFVGTVRATQRGLMRGGLLDRYSYGEVDDGFDGQEGTFTICTLWLVLALLEIGSVGEAEILFERVLGSANDLGLLSEELSPIGDQLGNFPQAFTHVAIIVCAFAIERSRRQLASSAA